MRRRPSVERPANQLRQGGDERWVVIHARHQPQVFSTRRTEGVSRLDADLFETEMRAIAHRRSPRRPVVARPQSGHIEITGETKTAEGLTTLGSYMRPVTVLGIITRLPIPEKGLRSLASLPWSLMSSRRSFN